MAGVGIGEGDENTSSGHPRRRGVDSPADPTGGRNEIAEEDKVQSGIVRVKSPSNGGLLGWEIHTLLEGFGGGDGGAMGCKCGGDGGKEEEKEEMTTEHGGRR